MERMNSSIAFLATLEGKLNIDPIHNQSLREIGRYIKSNKIEQLFNELLTNVLAERPESPRDFLREVLKKVKHKRNDKGEFEWEFANEFLAPKDFEAIFDSYDALGNNVVPISCLVQGDYLLNKRITNHSIFSAIS